MMNGIEALDIILGYKPNQDTQLMENDTPFRIVELFPNESDVLLKAIETAKKEHELLGLYKEKDKYPDDSNQCRDICIKITELERELK